MTWRVREKRENKGKIRGKNLTLPNRSDLTT
jgi:hypothetical protein